MNTRKQYFLALICWASALVFYDRAIQHGPSETFTSRIPLIALPIGLCALGSLLLVLHWVPSRPLPQSGAWLTLYRGLSFMALTAVAVLGVWAFSFSTFSP
jgi:hypothetical protein